MLFTMGVSLSVGNIPHEPLNEFYLNYQVTRKLAFSAKIQCEWLMQTDRILAKKIDLQKCVVKKQKKG